MTATVDEGSKTPESSASLFAGASESTSSSSLSSSASHFHCYLLHSADPSHPLKTYIGYTTDPHRRIRQHNGLLKSGGARRTRRSGRPWQYICIVHGFSNPISAMKFEWAWKHCHRSLAIRDVIGDIQAKRLQRRYGPRGKLRILKSMLIHCDRKKLYGSDDDDENTTDPLTLYFFDEQNKELFSNVDVATNSAVTATPVQTPSTPDETGLSSRTRQSTTGDITDEDLERSTTSEAKANNSTRRRDDNINIRIISSVEDMPFRKERRRQNKKRNKGEGEEASQPLSASG